MSGNSIVEQAPAEPQMNATPLIDVLLVLLVMLIFTLPIGTHAVKLNLPQGSPAQPSPIVEVAVEFDGRLLLEGEAYADIDALERAFRGLHADTLVKVVPDRRAAYDHVARVLAAAQRARITKLSVASFP
jgi:biopolymer transport protein ExbD